MANNRIRIERIVLALFITAFVARTASVYYAYLNFKTAEKASAVGRHARQVIDSLSHVQFTVLEIENYSNRFIFSQQPEYARLTGQAMSNLNYCMQGLLDSAKDDPANATVNELGKVVSGMEKAISSLLASPPPQGDYQAISRQSGILENLVSPVIDKSNEAIRLESQLQNTGRNSVVTKRHESLIETFYTSIIGIIFVLIILLFLNRDIRRRKIAEAKTRENEQKLRKIIEDVGDVIYSSDYKGNFTFINARLRSLTGYSNEELIGKHFTFLVHPEWMQKVQEFYMHQFKNKISETRFEFPIHTKKGKMKWVEQNVVLLQNGNRVEGFQCVVRDITVRKEAEENMRLALEKEKQINELKSRFVSLASHEFRTPLGTILSSTELIREYLDHQARNPALIRDKQIHHLNRIKSAIQNMVSTLNNFLSLDQLEHGKTVTRPSEFDITELSNKIIESLSEKLKSGQKITYLHSSELKTVFMDKNILDNVILNLLTNAIKYSYENSAIIYTTNVTAHGLEFTVEDHGIGIPESEQATLFERFFRAKNTLNIEGTGLGLSIVRRYVDLLGGHISFTSRENQGSTFKVFITNASRETIATSENKLINQE